VVQLCQHCIVWLAQHGNPRLANFSMSSSTLVGYSSGEEEEQKRQADANYEAVNMDMSEEEGSDNNSSGHVFASKDDYKAFKKQSDKEPPAGSSSTDARQSVQSEYGGGGQAVGKKQPNDKSHSSNEDHKDNEDSEQKYFEDLKKQQERERHEVEKKKQNSRSPDRRRRESSDDDSRQNRRRHHQHGRDDRHRHKNRRSRSRSREKHHPHRDRRKPTDDRYSKHTSNSGSRGSSSSRADQDRHDARNRKLQSLGLVGPSSTTATGEGATYESQLEKVKEITGVDVPKYYNPSVINPLRYAEQIKKRQMLWSKKTPTSGDSSESAAIPEPEQPQQPPPDQQQPNEASFNKWETTNFGNDQANEKFRRLMGIKSGGAQGRPSAATSSHTSVPPSAVTNQNTAKLFADQEEQYERARAITHTKRGLGLGFAGGLLLNPPQTAIQEDSPTILAKKTLSFGKK
jgi:hypothetical protein